MQSNSGSSVVFETLQLATSQDPSLFKPAEKKLQEWETVAGFYPALKDVYCNYNIDSSVRLLAVLYAKNGVDRYWRKTAPNAIPETEKCVIRSALLLAVNEPVNPIASQLSVLIAKIARYDFPNDWTELIPSLLNSVQCDKHLQQLRSLTILHQVVKSLSSKRLIADRRMFEELTAHVFSFVVTVWDDLTRAFIIKAQENDLDEATKYLEKAIPALKILEKLLVLGFKHPHESESANAFVKAAIQHMRTVLQIRVVMTGLNKELTEKFVVRSMAVLLNLLQQAPISFVNFIQPSLELAVFYVFTPEGEQFLFEKFLIQCFNLIKGIIMCHDYRVGRSKAVPGSIYQSSETETVSPATFAAHQMKKDFFNPHILTVMCKKLVTHYFLLNQNDLFLWESSPETFGADEAGESWKYSLRPSMEKLFIMLFREYRSVLGPVLVEMIRENHVIVPPDNLPAILSKDAVYNAAGLVGFDIYDEINFDEWFTTTLRSELQIPDSNYRIIRRRVAWLLGCWVNVKLSRDLHPLLYTSMIQLLSANEDMVVRITAANTIKIAVDDFEFVTETFLEFLEPIFRLLFNLLKEAEECDTKMKILNVLSFIVERVESSIAPYYQSLIQYLPLLWQESEHHNMLRCAVIATLVHLVRAIGKVNDSEEVSAFIYSVIALSTDVQQSSHVYLLEDGLSLWHAVLEEVPFPTPPIMELFKNMPPLFGNSTEHMRACVHIIQAYLLLSPDELLQVYGAALVEKCNELLPDIRSDEKILVLKLIELFIKVNSENAPKLLEPVLPKIFETIHKGEELPLVMSMNLGVLARVLFASTDIFIQVVNLVGQSVNQSSDSVLDRILDVWLYNMPLITQAEKKKLLGLALCRLLTAQSRFVYEKFCGILMAVAEVLNDITRPDLKGDHIDSLMFTEKDAFMFYDDEYNGFEGDETEHDGRVRRLALKDPVHSIVLQEYFKSQLNELQRSVGNQFDEFVQTVDVETLQMVREYVHI